MKLSLALSLLMLVFWLPAHAGSSNCTSPIVSLTASGGYTAQSSDCVISVAKSFFEFTQVTLPAGASVGDEFTVKDDTTAEPDCSTWEEETYCFSAGIGVRSADPNVMVDGAQNNTIFGVGQGMKVTFDGVDWQAVYF
jgi:hypothetical protein